MKRIAPIVSMIAGFALEGAALAIFLKAQPENLPGLALLLLALHVGSALLVSLSIYRFSIHWKHSSPKNWLITSLLLCFAFPVMGALFMASSFFSLVVSPSKKEGAYEEYEKYITYDFKAEEKYMASDRLLEGMSEELEVMPLVEVLGEDNATARQGVINVIEKLPKKDAVRLLKIALEDKSVEIRYAAAFELSRTEAEFNENIFMARKELTRTPDSADAHLALANGYSEYFESGLLDEYGAKYYRDLAVKEYEKALALTGGNNIQILNYMGHLELLSEKYEEAATKFKKVTALDSGNVFANVGLINIYFEKGQIHEAIRHAKEAMVRMPETKGPMREIVGYWAA